VAAGDARAGEVWQAAVDALADGLVTAFTLLDPRTLIIGGGLAEAGPTLFDPLREALRSRVTFQKLPEVVPAGLGDNAGCLGAGLLAWDLHAAAVRPPTDPASPASGVSAASAVPPVRDTTDSSEVTT
jgi:glucokinase